MTSTSYGDASKPRMAANAGEPGQYELVARVATPIVNRGGEIFAQQFITGYGNIRQCKIIFLGCHDVLESGVIRSGLDRGKNDKLIFGGDEFKFDSEHKGPPTFCCIMTGIKGDQWNEATMFFDSAKKDFPIPIISTESIDSRQTPPISHQYTIRKDAIPGNYEINTIMTYFNGEGWKTSSSPIRFTVRSRIETYENRIIRIGAIASGVAIYRLGLLPLWQWLILP